MLAKIMAIERALNDDQSIELGVLYFWTSLCVFKGCLIAPFCVEGL